MGYYTNYKVTAHPKLPPGGGIDAVLQQQTGYSFDCGEIQGAKWYSWREDMTSLSKKFSDILFTVDGEGEESGDLWRCYFKNGKSQLCMAQIVFDPYDESKLK